MQNTYNISQYNLLSTTLNSNLEYIERMRLLILLNKKPAEKYLHHLLTHWSTWVAKLPNDISPILHGRALIFGLWLERMRSFQHAYVLHRVNIKISDCY